MSDDEPNKIETTGCFAKAKMVALLQAFTRCVEMYPEPFYAFNIIIEGRYPVEKQSKLATNNTEETMRKKD